MELNVVNIKGENTARKVELPDSIVGVTPNDHAIYLDVKQYLANQRQGTSKSKERGEIAGSTRKIKRQKGTGGARAGAITSPVFVGGGRVFGPKPRNYRFKLNKKLKQLARLSAFAYKVANNQLTIVEDFTFDAPKTKEFSAIRNNLKANLGHSILVLNERNENIYLSSRNVQKSEIAIPSDLNTYTLMRAKSLVVTESAVNSLINYLSKED